MSQESIPLEISYELPSSNDLPRNTAHWKIVPDRAVLLVHDMQNYFVNALTPDLRNALLQNINRVKSWCAENGIPIAFCAQPGGMTEQQRGLLKDFWGAGMKRSPADRQIAKELAPAPTDWRLEKWRYSAFHQSGLLQRIQESKRDQLLITGVYAHIGILATATDAFSNDIETFIIGDAVADFSRPHHLSALTHAAQRCAVVLAAREVTK